MIQDKNEIKAKLLGEKEILNKYHISRVGLFGSYVHNSQKTGSDIDILVDFNETIDLFAYANLAEILSLSLKQRVDIVTINGLKPGFRDKILSEVEWIEGL